MFHFSNKQHSLRFSIDALCIIICYLAARTFVLGGCAVAFHLHDIVFQFSLVTCWYYGSLTCNLYTKNMGRVHIELLKTIYNIFCQGIFLVFVYYILDQPAYMIMFSAWYLILMIIIVCAQKGFLNAVRSKKRGKREQNNVLIVGGGTLGMKFFEYAKANPAAGYKVVGVLDNDQPAAGLNGHYLGKIDMLQTIFNSDMHINEVIVALPDSAVESLQQVISLSMNQSVHVKFMPDYSHFASPGFTIQTFGEMLMVNPRPEPLEALHWRAIKRLFDICFSLLVLVLLCSWLFPIIALMIKLSTKGPVFFKQLRSGKNKVPFQCYKFRSMFLNDDAHLLKATKNDPRITIVGKILRKTNIDELPQFFNVLMGNMTVVGPRPHMVSQNRVYSQIISQYLVRHLIKPGVTGWAQVNGYRGETKTVSDMQNRIEYDVWYLENWSFGLDIRIILRTVWNMVRGDDNAY